MANAIKNAPIRVVKTVGIDLKKKNIFGDVESIGHSLNAGEWNGLAMMVVWIAAAAVAATVVSEIERTRYRRYTLNGNDCRLCAH